MLVEATSSPGKDTQSTKFLSRWPKHLLAALLYLGFTLLLTWPLILNLTQAVPGSHDVDSDQNIWNLWWFKTALLDRHSNPYYTDLLHYPYWSKGLPLVFHNLQPLNGLMVLPVTATAGPVVAFNFVAILAFTLTAFNAYLLGLYFLKDWGAALLVGALYSYAPLHLGYFQFSNMETMTLEWIPLYILFLHLWTGAPGVALTKPKRGYLFLFLAALALLANALSDWYFTYYMFMYTALWFVWQLIRYRREWRTVLTRFALLGVVSAALASPLLWMLWQALKVSNAFGLVRGLQDEISWSAPPWGFLVPSKLPNFNPPQWSVYFFGYVALLLAAGSLLYRRKTGWWWLVAAIFIVLAMGPYVKLSDSSRVTETTGIPLPYLLIRELPLVSVSRIVGRFYFVADLAVVLLAGYGFLNLKEWLSRRKFAASFKLKRLEPALIGLLLCVWALEVQTLPVSLYYPQFYPFYTQYLQNNSDRRAILELPIPKNNDYSHDRMLNQTISGRPILSGYTARPVKDYYYTATSPFRLVIAPADLESSPLVSPDFITAGQQLTLPELLAYYQFGHAVLYQGGFTPDYFAETVKNFQSFAGTPVYQDKQITAFHLPPSAPLPGPRLFCGDNWYGAEQRGEETTFRWAKNGDGYVGLLAPQAGKGSLSFQGWSFSDESEVSVMVNGVQQARWRISPVPQTYSFDLSWTAGENSLEFKTTIPGKSPGKGDTRNLTFALGNLTLK